MSDSDVKLPKQLKETPPAVNKPVKIQKKPQDYIAMAIVLLEKEQAGKGKCRENRKALNRLNDSIQYLWMRDERKKAE